jgi:hypothetical protein
VSAGLGERESVKQTTEESGSCACLLDQGGGLFPSVRCITRFPDGMTQEQVNAITEAMGPTNSSCLVRSTSDCAPQGAEIVWGPYQELVGFSCYSNANGS